MQYSDQTVKVFGGVMEYLIKNALEKGANFVKRCFLRKEIKKIGREGRDALTKEMEQLYRQTF